MTTLNGKSLPTQNKAGWTGRTGGGEWGQKFLISLLSHMSVGASYLLLDIALPFYLPFNRRGFRATRDYFRKRMGYGRCSAWRNAYATHRLFGQMMFDRFRFRGKGMSGLTVSVVGRDEFLECTGSGEGCVAAGAHVGNMEITGYMLGRMNVPINAVVFGGESETMKSHRSGIMAEHGVKMIPVKDDMSHLFIIKAALDAGEIVSMPCDRLFGSKKYFELEFLGAPARFPVGAFMLAAQTGKNLVTLFNMKEGKRDYKVYMKVLEVPREGRSVREIASALAAEYVKALEAMVREYPRQWFNFYDFWKLDE